MPDTDNVQTLAAAIDRRTAEGAALRGRYTAALEGLASRPDELDQLVDIERELSRNAAGLQALHQAHEAAVDAARTAARNVAVAAVESTRAHVVKTSARRLKMAEKLQQAGDAFVAAVRDWADIGAPLQADVACVIRARYDSLRMGEQMSLVVPQATGTDAGLAEAVAAVHRRVREALNSPCSEAFDNPFTAEPRIGFVEAATKAHAQLVERMGDAK